MYVAGSMGWGEVCVVLVGYGRQKTGAAGRQVLKVG